MTQKQGVLFLSVIFRLDPHSQSTQQNDVVQFKFRHAYFMYLEEINVACHIFITFFWGNLCIFFSIAIIFMIHYRVHNLLQILFVCVLCVRWYTQTKDRQKFTTYTRKINSFFLSSLMQYCPHYFVLFKMLAFYQF